MNTKLTALAASFALSFATGAYAQMSSSSDSSAPQSKQQIDQEYKTAMEKCKSVSGSNREVCRAEATGQRKIAEAQAKVNESDTPQNRQQLGIVKANAKYNVDELKCNIQAEPVSGNVNCLQQAETERTQAIAAARKQAKTSAGGNAAGSSGSGSDSSDTSPSNSPGGSSMGQPASPPSQQQPGQSR